MKGTGIRTLQESSFFFASVRGSNAGALVGKEEREGAGEEDEEEAWGDCAGGTTVAQAERKRRDMPIMEGVFVFTEDVVYTFLFLLWCRGEDSNLHRITPTRPSSVRVYHSTTTAHRKRTEPAECIRFYASRKALKACF